MNSTHSFPDGNSPFVRWMKICIFPASFFYEVFGAHEGEGSYYERIFYTHVLIAALFLMAMFGGTGLILWGVMKVIALGLRRTRRQLYYYPAEKEHRRQLAAERRKIRQRTTINAAPTADELLAQFARVKRNPQEMIRFGSMLNDLEAYVDNSLRRDDTGTIVGRNPGIKGWLAENCNELAVKYTTVMRYKALARQFQQAVGLRDPYPAALALPEQESADGEDGNEITVRTADEAGENVEEDGNEITVRTTMKQGGAWTEVEKAREVAKAFFSNCKATQRSLVAELDERLRPECVPADVIRRERALQGLSPEPGLAERLQNMLA